MIKEIETIKEISGHTIQDHHINKILNNAITRDPVNKLLILNLKLISLNNILEIVEAIIKERSNYRDNFDRFIASIRLLEVKQLLKKSGDSW